MITLRSATFDDLDGIMNVEEKKWEEGTAATREVMEDRIRICNSKEPHYFFVAVENNRITGYLVMQPTDLTPDTCVSWTSATDNGIMKTTYKEGGPNLYVVSICAISPPKASADTADRIMARVVDLWCRHGGILMFTARMPGFSTAHEKTGITPDEYWQLKKIGGGGPQDAGIQFYWSRSGGVEPTRLLKNGFPSDVKSGGHAVLYVLKDVLSAQEAIQNHLCHASHHVGKKEGRRRKSQQPKPHEDPRVAVLDGGRRRWWDAMLGDFVPMHTLYIPQGCEWNKWAFCPIPQAITEYEKLFFNGLRVPDAEIVSLFSQILTHMIDTHPKVHTLCLFNAGSFLSDVSNPPLVREQIIELVCQTPNLSRLIIETNANDVTVKNMHALCSQLGGANIDLTVRIGVETQNQTLRLKYLKKGQTDKALRKAVHTIHMHGALAGGYVLLNPAPFSNIRALLDAPEESDERLLLWAEEEAIKSLDFVLSESLHGLGMDEAYFCSTNVGPGTLLTQAWEQGDFRPASLRMVYSVLRQGITKYGTRIHLLPFKDERGFLAVPSNHVPQGIAQDLKNAVGCDVKFHNMLNRYRETMNPFVLVVPSCTCNI